MESPEVCAAAASPPKTFGTSFVLLLLLLEKPVVFRGDVGPTPHPLITAELFLFCCVLPRSSTPLEMSGSVRAFYPHSLQRRFTRGTQLEASFQIHLPTSKKFSSQSVCPVMLSAAFPGGCNYLTIVLLTGWLGLAASRELLGEI